MKLILSVAFAFITLSAFAQKNDSLPPAFKRFPTHPPLQILMGDSSSKYTKENIPKKTPVLVMIFSPDCEHCNQEAEEMVKYKDELKDIQIIMITFQPLWKMNDFVSKHQLAEMKNIVVGKDIYYLMSGFYEMKNLPFHALYNKKGELIETFEGAIGLKKIIKSFKDN